MHEKRLCALHMKELCDKVAVKALGMGQGGGGWQNLKHLGEGEIGICGIVKYMEEG
jgi:hypothetical protein